MVAKKLWIAGAISCAGFTAYAQDTCIHHWETVIHSNDSWRYAVDSVFEDQEWKLASYNDSLWSAGRGGIGYGDQDDSTLVAKCKVLYMRKLFMIQDTGMICKALLSIDYDDAFVAWLNGGEIARSGVSGVFPDAESPVVNNEAAMYAGGYPENFFIDADSLASYLRPGENLLSFQIHNQSHTSSDLSSVIFFSMAVSSPGQTYGPFAEEIKLPVAGHDSFDIPLVLIETNGETIVRGPKITAGMKIIHHGNGFMNHPADSGNVYTGKIGIKIRGSSSSGFPQKSYRLETRDSAGENRNVPLLNMPEENDWLLISNYYDRSFVRNYLSHEIFRGMGHYSPRIRFCEVILNGDYQGVYLLMEKIKADKERIDIAKLRYDENSGDDLTGGYIIKNDNYLQDGSDSWQVQFPAIEEIGWNAVNARFVYVYPDWDTISIQQKEYIQDFIETSKDVLYSPAFKDPLYGYYAYFDVGSFVDYFIVSEVSRNGDAYKKSRFFHKDKESKDGKLHAGPPWDFDWAWKNLFFQQPDGSGWVHTYEAYGYADVQPVRYVNQMLQDASFSNEVYHRYFSLRQTVLHFDSLSFKIDSIANYLSEAQARHFEQWDILNGDSGDPDTHVPDSFEDEIIYLKGWIHERLTWLDAHMVKFREEDTFSDQSLASLSPVFRIFPNPASDVVHVESNEPVQRMEVLTTDGIVVLCEGEIGKRSCTLHVQSLHPGLYFVRISVKNHVFTRIIVKI